jgi:hypothetical protein
MADSIHAPSRELLEFLIRAAGDASQVDHVWLVDECQPGAVLTPPPAPAHEPNRIYFVDLYAKGQLMLFIPASQEYTSPPAHRMLALDSNMFAGFKRYVLGGERNTEHVAGIEQLVEYAVIHGYGLLPTPYLLEVIMHHGIEGARLDCEAITEAVLRLHHMDGEAFRSSRSFSYTELALSRLEQKYSTRDFRLAAVKITENFLGQPILFRSHYFISYLAVLALIDIGRRYSTTETRIAAFDELLLKRVGGLYPRFMLLARLFFYGKISGWLKTAPGSSVCSVNSVRGAAYDVALTMVNEEWMQVSMTSEPDVLMLVTRDHQLALHAPMIRLKGISVLKNGDIRVLNPWDEALVASTFGAKAPLVRSDIDTKIEEATKLEIPPAALIAIIQEYEGNLGLPPSRLSSLKF